MAKIIFDRSQFPNGEQSAKADLQFGPPQMMATVNVME
jgi:hypothetical protein